MKKHLFLIFLILSFVACNKTTKEEPVLELIAYRWILNEKYSNNIYEKWSGDDVAYIQPEIYAQIFNDGNCMLSKYRGNNQNELYPSFKIDTTILSPVLRIINSINKDTTMIVKSEPGKYIYDGPYIRIIGKNKNGLIRTIKFDNSNFSNTDLQRLFSHIELKSDSAKLNNTLIQSKEKRIQEIYNQEIILINIPIIKPDEEW